jgi:uncharacterized membrane protein
MPSPTTMLRRALTPGAGLTLVAFALTAVLLAPAQAVAQKGKPAPSPPPYVYAALKGADGDYVEFGALAISDPDIHGIAVVAGEAGNVSQRDVRPTLWEVTLGGAVDDRLELERFPGVARALAVAVNDFGIAVGHDHYLDVPGFAYVPGIGVQALPPHGGLASRPYGVNNHGVVVGQAERPDLRWPGALWHVDGDGNVSDPIDLGQFIPCAINDDGIMAGRRGGVPAVAYLDEDGLLVRELAEEQGVACAINAFGDVVGWVGGRAFACPADGELVVQPDMGGSNNRALAINDHRQVVGWVFEPVRRKGGVTTRKTAVLWEGGELFDLNALTELPSSARLESAAGINNLGQVVGRVRVSGSKTSEAHGFLLTRRP